MTSPFENAQLGPITLRNRVIKAATFEGMTPESLVTDDLIDFHRAVAAGGVGMTTLAYLATSPEGRTHRESLWGHPDVGPGLARLAEAVHAEGAKVSAQIGHAGPVANSKSNGLASITATKMPDIRALRFTHQATDADLRRILDDFANTARIAADAGFDCIEIHLGHNYLPSSFLSKKLNQRSDQWGGSLENRARFPREVVTRVRDEVDGEVAVIAKFNMADGVGGGLWLDESLQVAQWLEADGGLDAIELTGGSSLGNPMYLFRGDAPLRAFAKTQPPLMRFGLKLVGKRFLKSYPFEEAYFLPFARQFRAALSMPLVLLGGINRLDTIHRALDEGFEFVAMGRALLRDPQLIDKFQKGSANEGLCIHCNKCMPTIYEGTHCVLVPR